MRKNYFIIALCVALAVCLWFLLQPDKQHDINNDDYVQVIDNDDSLRLHEADYRRVIDSLSIDNYRLDSINGSLKVGQAITRLQLDLKTSEAKGLAKEVQRLNKDTALTGKIDSLVNQITNLSFLLGQYEAYSDSLNHVNDSLKINYDEQLKAKDKRIAELQAAYDSLFRAYQDLFATSRGLMKDIKRERLKTKIVGVLALGAAVLGLVK